MIAPTWSAIPSWIRTVRAARWWTSGSTSRHSTRLTQAIHSYDGTAGRNIIDGPGLKNVDMTIARSFRLSERKSLQFRGEATNALNLVNLSNPGTNANTASTFGKITTARAMRQAQVGLKLVF